MHFGGISGEGWSPGVVRSLARRSRTKIQTHWINSRCSEKEPGFLLPVGAGERKQPKTKPRISMGRPNEPHDLSENAPKMYDQEFNYLPYSNSA